MSYDLFIYILYLFYGLVFFTMGASIAAKSTRHSSLDIGRHLWLFSLFAFLVAFREWSELYMALALDDAGGTLLLAFKTGKLLPIFFSFFLLLLFAVRVLGGIFPAMRRGFLLLAAVLVLGFAWSVTQQGLELSPQFLHKTELLLRNCLGFPAAVLAGLAFILYSKTVRHISDLGARHFTGAGLCLIVYGFFAGLIPSRSPLWPMGMHVEIYRTVSAVFVLHFVMKALHVFDLERQAQIAEREQRFAQSEKLASLGKLAAGIAHEVNNPLTNVSLGLEMLKREISAGKAVQSLEKRFAAIERNLDRASRIARELLHFARHEVMAEEEFEPVEINEVIRHTLTLLEPQRQEYLIRTDLTPLPPVYGVPLKLEQVFLNLLTNAMEASASKGEITVSSHAEEDCAVVKIADRGIGIPPENLHLVFDPFYSTKEVGKGTGLGLSICFGIMERHGGKIDIESKSGSGTTVTLVFPVRGDNET